MIPIGIQSYLLRRHDWTLQTYITVSPIIFFGRYENGFLGSYIGIPFYFEGDNWFGGEIDLVVTHLEPDQSTIVHHSPVSSGLLVP